MVMCQIGAGRRSGLADHSTGMITFQRPRLRSAPLKVQRSRICVEYASVTRSARKIFSSQMATVKRPKSAILAKRVSKGPRGKRTRAQPRQYTVVDLERARDRVMAAERRVDNDYTSDPGRDAGLERAKLELHIVESQLRLRGLLE
jgi:hypothetical protein